MTKEYVIKLELHYTCRAETEDEALEEAEKYLPQMTYDYNEYDITVESATEIDTTKCDICGKSKEHLERDWCDKCFNEWKEGYAKRHPEEKTT